jgi:hypothetical protein
MNEDVELKRACSINWKNIEAEVEKVTYNPGMYEAINVEALIDEIYVAPTAADYYLDVVERVCRQFSLKKKIRRSDLASSPIR